MTPKFLSGILGLFWLTNHSRELADSYPLLRGIISVESLRHQEWSPRYFIARIIMTTFRVWVAFHLILRSIFLFFFSSTDYSLLLSSELVVTTQMPTNMLCQSTCIVQLKFFFFSFFRKRIGLNFGECVDGGIRNTFHVFSLRYLCWSNFFILHNCLPFVLEENRTSKTSGS